MKKVILFVLVFSLVIPSLLIFPGTSVRACGDREPVTLLALVRQSKTIHIATYRGQDEGDVQKDKDEDVSYREIKRNFDVTSTLMGETVKFVTIPNRQYIYDEELPAADVAEQAPVVPGSEAENPSPESTVEPSVTESQSAEESEEYDEDGQKALSPGDSVILFLTTDEESKAVQPTDWVDGIKSISHADIGVYEARIKEIMPILAAKKPDADKIVDWLVRLVEDPVTRWDGAYELEQSFNAKEQKAAMEAEQKQTPKKEDEERPEIPYKSDTLDTGLSTLFATKLGEHHQQTLTNTLIQSRFRNAQKKAGSDGLVAGDRELMRIVARWADDRVALMFIDQIRSDAYATYDKSSLMSHVATILADKDLSEMAAKFEENSYQDDEEAIETAKAVATIRLAEGEKTGETENVTSATGETQPVPATSAAKPTAKKPAMTYKRLRDDLTSKFLKRAETVIAENQVRAAK